MAADPVETRNALARALSPRSVALVGASERSSASAAVLAALRDYGYTGELHLVNRRGEPVGGQVTHRRLADIGGPVDLALVMVPAAGVPGVIAECAQLGVGAAVVFSSGFAEVGAQGRVLQAELAAARRGSGPRLLGPNAEGFLNLVDGVAASFSSSVEFTRLAADLGISGRDGGAPTPQDVIERARGTVAVVAQSGGLAFSLFRRGLARGMGFSRVLSTGNEADLAMADVLDYLVEDPHTRVVLAYLEGLRDPRRFVATAARARERGTALVVAKVGRSPAGARAALSHTGHLAGDEAAYQAVFDRHGVVSVRDADEMLDAGLALSLNPRSAGNRAAIVSLSGGNAVWMADACAEAGIELSPLEETSSERIRAMLPAFASTTNPVDVSGEPGVPPAEVLAAIADDPGLDILVLITTLARPSRLEVDRPALERLRKGPKPILLTTYTDPDPTCTATLRELGIPVYPNTRRCAWAAAALAATATTTDVHDPAPDLRGLNLGGTLAEWRNAQTGDSVPEYRVGRLLRQAGVPVAAGSLAIDADEAVSIAAELGGPVALKLQSAGVAHKAKVGAVALGVEGAAAVRSAFAAVTSAVAAPGLAVDGVLVQRMVPTGVEVIVGVQNASGFGPMVLVGIGGGLVEVVGRTELHPAPLGPAAALKLLRRLRLDRLHPDDPQCTTLLPLAALVSRVSAIAVELGDELEELDLNPVILGRDGDVTVVDALAVLSPPG